MGFQSSLRCVGGTPTVDLSYCGFLVLELADNIVITHLELLWMNVWMDGWMDGREPQCMANKNMW